MYSKNYQELHLMLLLYMDTDIRSAIIARHTFYTNEANARILSQFQNLESEFESFYEFELVRLAKISFGGEHGDGVPALAYENAIGHYSMLDRMQKQMLLSVLAGIFHQWDKELRDFMSTELSRMAYTEGTIRDLWKSYSIGIEGFFKELDWNWKEHDFYIQINECREIVNIYKHGEGNAMENLKKSCPQYFGKKNDLPPQAQRPWNSHTLNHKDLEITQEHLDGFANAITSFWSTFPERIYSKTKSI